MHLQKPMGKCTYYSCKISPYKFDQPILIHTTTSLLSTGVSLRSSNRPLHALTYPVNRVARPAGRVNYMPQASSSPETETSTEAPATSNNEKNENGSSSSSSAISTPEIQYIEPTGMQRAMTNFRLFFALPWRRFKSDSALSIKFTGAIAEKPQPRFSSTLSLPAICDSLQKAAVDPRISGLVVKIDPLQCGWAKLQEIRRHVELFKESGKWTVAYMERAGEKEYYLATAFDEIYCPPSGSISLLGFSVSGTFLRGVFEKIGIEPEVRRIGKFKSAGDQLLRSDMSEAQSEQLNALLDDIYEDFVDTIATARKKNCADVENLLNSGIFEMEKLLQGGWVDGLKYADEVDDIVKERTGGKEDELRFVPFKKYKKVGRSAFNLDGGKKAIAIVRTSGAITGGSSGNGITSGDVIAQLRRLKKQKNIAAVVLRVDSPGGDALASDLMWREIQKLSEEKPVIASMADVAASGGYYMAMACRKIVAEPLTITGSIGVVAGKFSLEELYKKVGYNKETLSKGKYAQLFLESRPQNQEESDLFDASAQHAYESFRNKAAESRGMEYEALQEVAQGRVWSGKRAVTIGLVDAVGGINRAIALAKEAAEIDINEKVRILEVSRGQFSPLQLISGGGGASMSLQMAATAVLLLKSVMGVGGGSNNASISPAAALGAPALMEIMAAISTSTGSSNTTGIMGAATAEESLMEGLARGQVMAQMPAYEVEGVVSKGLQAQYSGNMGDMLTGSEVFDS
jgi:protease IV